LVRTTFPITGLVSGSRLLFGRSLALVWLLCFALSRLFGLALG
jgi:hypothetical protein